MKTRVAFDISGLAWKYRTGVQNLLEAYVQSVVTTPAWAERFEFLFYDRSGIYNARLAGLLDDRYQSVAPAWWPGALRRPLQLASRAGVLGRLDLNGYINHVNNWDLYHPSRARGSITIPDILPLEYPQWFSPRFQRLTEASLRFAGDQAEFVFCISQYVKERVVATTGLPAERVKVAYPGIDPIYLAPVDPQEEHHTLARFGLERRNYLLSSGFLDPRKNLPNQIRAFEHFVAAHPTSCKYALTGLKTALSDELMTLLEGQGLRDRVVFLGYVSPAELRVLMGGAAIVMYCSLAEGFGLPVIEAMAAGSPVITSATTSMKELAEGRTRLVDPHSIDDIAAAIGEVLAWPDEYAQAYQLANRLYAGQFTLQRWTECHLEAMAEGS